MVFSRQGTMMIPAEHPLASATARKLPPAPAAALFAASLMTILMLAHHPVATHRDGAALVADLVQLGDAAKQVHTMIIALVGMLLYGVTALALRLELRRPAIAFGLAAYGFGCAAMVGAMLLDGFASVAMARWLLAHAQATSPPDIANLALIAIGIQVLTRAGFAGMGLGILCLSWSRPAGRPLSTVLAVLALPGGLLPLLAVGFSVYMAPHSLMALTAVQALWYLGAAWMLWRGLSR
jgi:hypothetical protein